MSFPLPRTLNLAVKIKFLFQFRFLQTLFRMKFDQYQKRHHFLLSMYWRFSVSASEHFSLLCFTVIATLCLCVSLFLLPSCLACLLCYYVIWSVCDRHVRLIQTSEKKCWREVKRCSHFCPFQRSLFISSALLLCTLTGQNEH